MQPKDYLESSPACHQHSSLFQHSLLEDPPALATLNAQERLLTQRLNGEARHVCLDCPMFSQCLYDSVVKHDVCGYAGATTHRQRLEIRRRLGIRVRSEDLDTLAGIPSGHRIVDHDEVVRLRNANPYDSLESIAHRLGCSLSTVKRHLRQARHEPAPLPPTASLPTHMQVLTAFAEVVSPRSGRRQEARRSVSVSA